MIPHDAFIGRARNLMVKRFLECGASDLVFIDADIGFCVDDFIKLMKADGDIVCGVYRYKKDDLAWPHMEYQPIEKKGDLVRIHHAGCGFMRVKRNVFERIKKANPDNVYRDDVHGDTYDFFPAGRIDNKFYGEDVIFCKAAEQNGFKIWGLQGLNLKHTGSKTWQAAWSAE